MDLLAMVAVACPSAPILVVGALPAVAAPAETAASDPLARYRWSHRVVVALAPSADDATLLVQRRIFADLDREAAERDLVLVVATDGTPAARALRRRFGGAPGFLAVLVGKDGGAKLSSAQPLDAAMLLPLIDAMPMRQSERARSARAKDAAD